MKNIIHWSGLRILRDKKIRVLLLFFLVFFGSFSLLYRQQNLTTPYLEMREEYEDEQQIYRLIPQSHFEGELGQEVQQRLGNNSVSLSVQRYILSREEGNEFENLSILPDYNEAGQQLVENNLFLYEATEFGSHELLVNEYLPPLEEVQEQGRFFEALAESGLNVDWNYFSASQVLKAQGELIAGVLLFLLVALFASDQFTKDRINHWSVTHGLPIPWKMQWRIRSLFLFGLFWIVIIGGTLLSYFIGTLLDDTGSLAYPVGIYLENGLHYIPLWQYLGIILLLSMLLSYVLLLITTGLSWMIQNIYLTILLVAGLFILPQFWELLPAFSSWQPSLYLNLMGVLDGTTAQSVGLNGVVWWKAGIIYLVMIVVLELIFNWVFSRIPTETAGLKRRVLT